MMHIPQNEAALDEVARDLTAGTNGCPEDGLRYRELPVEQRVIVMQLTQQRGIDASLDNIDAHLSHVAHWFELSKIYHP